MIKENVYDGLFILNSEAYARDPEGVSGAIAKTIESLGGTVRVSRFWEEKKLAYPINRHRRGVYWLSYFRITTDKLEELNRQFRLNNNIIRFLITTIDPRLEETLVKHALEGPDKAKEESEVEVQEVAVEESADETAAE